MLISTTARVPAGVGDRPRSAREPEASSAQGATHRPKSRRLGPGVRASGPAMFAIGPSPCGGAAKPRRAIGGGRPPGGGGAAEDGRVGAPSHLV